MNGFSIAGPRPDSAWRTALRRTFVALPLLLGLGGCLGYDGSVVRGYVVDDQTLAQIKIGMAAPQVLSTLGNPSTTSTVGGGTWYYISQIMDQSLAFMQPQVVDQRVVAVYFDKSNKVERIANYGMRDGKLIDFISRTTPTGGKEQSFLTNILRGLGRL